MSVAIQIRDVPEEVRDLLAAKAKGRGQSMQAYLLDLVTSDARTLTPADVFWSTAHLRVEVPAELDPVAIIREFRDEEPGADREDFDG